MGYTISTIIIENVDNLQNERLLLDEMGFAHFIPKGTTSFDESMHPLDGSINIGFYENYIFINDENRFTESIYAQKTSDFLELLMSLFPQSKILHVCCISTNGFQGYHLIEHGKRIRYQTNGQDYGFSEGFNPLLAYDLIPNVEREIFKLNDEYFVYEIIQHLMSLDIDNEAFMCDTVFHKYQNEVEENWDEEGFEDEEFNYDTIINHAELNKKPIKKMVAILEIIQLFKIQK
jgi:hypothetical protein